MKKRCLTALAVISFVIVLVGILPVRGESEIYDSVIRLHVLANSDSEEDQALKLKVRDAVLEVTAPLLKDCSDRSSAEELVTLHMDDIQGAAEAVIAENSCSDPVAVTLSTESYPTRKYDSFCFPSGDYLSLRVCIGKAEGHNWWCCLFPPLCLGSSTVSKGDAEDGFISVGFTPSQYKIITESDRPVYRVRFKILEFFRK